MYMSQWLEESFKQNCLGQTVMAFLDCGLNLSYVSCNLIQYSEGLICLQLKKSVEWATIRELLIGCNCLHVFISENNAITLKYLHTFHCIPEKNVWNC